MRHRHHLHVPRESYHAPVNLPACEYERRALTLDEVQHDNAFMNLDDLYLDHVVLDDLNR